jgi:hypothetical protein
MSSLSREAILTVLSGLTLLACDKAATVTAEPSASTPLAAAQATPASSAVSAKEVPPAQAADSKKAAAGAASARPVEKSCAPGGCAAGQCGAGKK